MITIDCKQKNIYKTIFIVTLILYIGCFSCQAQALEWIDSSKELMYIYDQSTILEDEITTFNQLLDRFEQEYKIKFVIVVLPELQEKDINKQANDLFSQLQIANQETQKGILLLLSKEEQEVRLEISYDLEEVFTDTYCGYVLRQQMRPFFEIGSIRYGLMDCVHAIINRLQEYTDNKNRVGLKTSGHLSGGAGSTLKVDFNKGLEKKLRLSSYQRQFFKAQDDPQKTLLLFAHSLRYKVNTPDLDIYTSGAKIFNIYEPRNTYEYEQYHKKMEEGTPWKVQIQGDYAVIKMKEGTKGTPDYFLKKCSDNKWRLDLMSSIKNMRYLIDGNWIMYLEDNPYMFAYNKTPVMVRPDNDRDIRAEIQHWTRYINKNPYNYKGYLQLAELYFYDCYVPDISMDFYEKAAEKAEDNPYLYYLWGLRLRDLNKIDKAIDVFKQAMKINPLFTESYAQIGITYCFSNRIAESLPYLNMAYRLDNQNEYVKDTYEKAKIIKSKKDTNKYILYGMSVFLVLIMAIVCLKKNIKFKYLIKLME